MVQLHADEPLLGGAEDHRVVAAPAVRVRVRQLLHAQQRARFLQKLDHDGVAFPHRLADQVVRQVSRRAFRAEESARRIHRTKRRDAVLLPDGVVFLSVSGRGVHRPGALFQRHVVGQDAHRIALEKRMAEHRAFDPRALKRRDRLVVAPAQFFRRHLHQVRRHQVHRARHVHRRVLVARIVGDRHVRRDGPRRGGPDQPVDVAAGERRIDRRRVRRQREPHPDRRAGVVGVLHFRFGQRRAVLDAPVHRLEALVHVAAIQEIHERAGDHGLILRAHREIRIFPAAQHAQALEILPLDVDILLRVLAAGAADLHRRHLRLLRPELVIDLDLDGQAVAIPARNVGRIEARHGLRFDDKILEDFIERGAQVNPPVGVRRPVVQHVSGPARARGANLVIQLLLLPPRQHLRLGLRQVGLHGESGRWQIDRLLQHYVLRIHCRGNFYGTKRSGGRVAGLIPGSNNASFA